MTGKKRSSESRCSWEDNEIRVALALGGGGVKGAAHIGMLEVLLKNNIPIDLLVGSSVGAFIAAGFSYYKLSDIMLDKFLSASLYDIVDISFINVIKMMYSPTGICDGRRMIKVIEHQLPNIDVSKSDIPSVYIATDINTFEPYEIKTGNLIKAIRASTAIPPYYSPVELNGRTLIDGAICSPLPADVAKKYGAKIVIALDISSEQAPVDTSNMLKVFYSSLEVSFYQTIKYQREYADIIIHPKLNFPTLAEVDFHAVYEEGKKAALKAIPAIKKALQAIGHEI